MSIAALFEDWGLTPGANVCGWTLQAVELATDGSGAFAALASGESTLIVRLKPAGKDPYFKRIGPIDLAHDSVPAEVAPMAGKVVQSIAARIAAHDGARTLAQMIDAAGRQKIPAPNRPNGAQPYVVVHDAPPLDPAKRAPPDRPVIEFDFIDVSDVAKYPDALREIYRGERGGFVIHNVYPKDQMAEVVERLEGAQRRFPLMHLPEAQRSYFLGLCLEGGDPTLREYLESAARFREEAARIFEGLEPFEQRVEGVFRAMAGGRSVKLARYTDGRAYTPATIRILPVGGQLAPHCGNEMYRRPSYEHLNSFVDGHDQLSYFLTLQDAEAGGGLIIYSLKWDQVPPEHILPDERSNVGLLLADAEWTEVRPGPGDVLIFDGGRYLHRVDWVRGSRTRWTMGGFLMFDRPGETLLYFA